VTHPPEAADEAAADEAAAEVAAAEEAAAELAAALDTMVVEVRDPETPPLAVTEAVLVLVTAPGTSPEVEAVAFKQALDAPAWIW
jgi:hypothetical protein